MWDCFFTKNVLSSSYIAHGQIVLVYFGLRWIDASIGILLTEEQLVWAQRRCVIILGRVVE